MYVAVLLLGVLVCGCNFFTYDDSDEIVSVDKTVTPEILTRVTTHLLAKDPKIRTEKEKLAQGGRKVKLTVSILSAPDPHFSKMDRDYRYHANYYWVYVSYGSKDGILKYSTYLVHKDLADIYVVDSEADTFVKVAP